MGAAELAFSLGPSAGAPSAPGAAASNPEGRGPAGPAPAPESAELCDGAERGMNCQLSDPRKLRAPRGGSWSPPRARGGLSPPPREGGSPAAPSRRTWSPSCLAGRPAAPEPFLFFFAITAGTSSHARSHATGLSSERGARAK